MRFDADRGRQSVSDSQPSAVRRWTPVVLWGAAILLVTSIPGSAIPATPLVPGLDKVVHAGLYGALGWLAGGAMARGPARPVARGGMTGALLAIALFAAGDEWHQRFIPGRGADPLDWGADVAGGALGLALAAYQTLYRTARARRETRT